MTTYASLRDLRAAQKLGIPVSDAEIAAAVARSLGIDPPMIGEFKDAPIVIETGALPHWDIPSDSTPGRVHRVDQRRAKQLTTNAFNIMPGDIYYQCSCPTWKFQFGRGRYCKHVEYVLANLICDDCGRTDGSHDNSVEH